MYDLSVIIPVLNEAKNIPILFNKLKQVLQDLPLKSEIIFVDDGSRDNTHEILRKIQVSNKNMKYIRFRKNCGKSSALRVGIQNSNAHLIITMDGDLQDHPSEINKLLLKINEGYDLVCGWRVKRKDKFTKKLFSRFFNFLNKTLTGLKLHDANCGFKIMKKEVAESIRITGELHRYIPTMAFWKGYRVGETKIKHYPRIYGKTKYKISRLFKGFIDLITIRFLYSYFEKPVHLFGIAGLTCFLVGTLVELNVIFLKYIRHEHFGTHIAQLILGVVLIIFGIQLISIGLIGAMITNAGNISDESPEYRYYK